MTPLRQSTNEDGVSGAVEIKVPFQTLIDQTENFCG